MLSPLIGPVNTIEDVIGTMQTLDSVLPPKDGVKWLNFLYLKVTEAVQAEGAGWQDSQFLQRFDVAFAKLYFDAIVKWEQDQTSTPHAWRPLLRARNNTRVVRVRRNECAHQS